MHSQSAKNACLQLVRRCAERAQRAQRLRPMQAPRGGVWHRIGREGLGKVLVPTQVANTSAGGTSEEGDGLTHLKRGFLQRPRQESTRQAKQQGGPASPASPPLDQRQDVLPVHRKNQRSNSVVYSNGEVRSARSAWLSLPSSRRLRWDQTSTEVSAWVKVPRGTRAKEVSVQVTPTQLTVSLGWFGRVADSGLSHGVKAGEVHWCLEDDEVHVLLPKDPPGTWWRALLEGGDEKGYYELLQEAVNAGANRHV